MTSVATIEAVPLDEPVFRRDVDYYAPGMEHIRSVLSEKEVYFPPTDRYVGSFGITSEDGQNLLIHWKVSGDRRDKRHGAIKPRPSTHYGKDLFNSMFKGW